MFRTLILTAAIAIGLAATTVEAGNLKVNFGGGSSCASGNCRIGGGGGIGGGWHRNIGGGGGGGWHRNHITPVCKYRVCYYKPCWGYKQHRIFHSYYAAKNFAYQLRSRGYRVSIAKHHGGLY